MLFTSTLSWKNTKEQRHWVSFCSSEHTLTANAILHMLNINYYTLVGHCIVRIGTLRLIFSLLVGVSLFVSSLFTVLLSDKKVKLVQLWHKRRMCVFSCVQMFWLSRGHLKSVVYLNQFLMPVIMNTHPHTDIYDFAEFN